MDAVTEKNKRGKKVVSELQSRWKPWVLLLQNPLLAATLHVPQELIIRVEHWPNYTLLNRYVYIVLYCVKEMYP